MNPNYGIPLISTCLKEDAPSIDNATWFSMTGEPPGPEVDNYGWEWNPLGTGWISRKLNDSTPKK